ncbi:uncharacterized protein LOC132286097 isoform X2 [Cornus florida]|nr:uncharacterized protein LOC132286097 isoform X2 [Cornus florida]XP_059644346.1 uncharacterized protein LOC132286097 isoform X2 [Cornus florida]
MRRKNVMSVDLAIQRELAYWKKLKSLQLLADVVPMPLHVPSSIPSPSPLRGRNWDSNSSLNLVPSSSSPRLSSTPSRNTSSRPGPSSISSASLVQGPLYQVSSSSSRPSPWLAQKHILSSSLSLVSSPSNLAPSSTLNPRPALVPSRILSSRPGRSPNLVQSSFNQVSSSNSSPSSNLNPRLPLVPSRIPSPRLGQRSNPSPTPRPLPKPGYIRGPSSWMRPRPSLSSTKRKASTCNLQRLPPQQPRPSHSNHIKTDQEGLFICDSCKVPCSGALNFKQHQKGQKHKAKLQQLQLSREEDKEEKDLRPWCELCQIWCIDEDSLQMHLKGQNTRLNYDSCKLCQIWCIDEDSLQMHLKGQKHQAKLQQLEIGKKNGGDHPWCELCQIWCMNEDAFEQHLKGKNHVTRLYATGN